MTPNRFCRLAAAPLTLLVLFCGSATAATEPTGDGTAPALVMSRYAFLVEQAAGGTAAEQRIFARAALAALAEAYRDEVRVARRLARGRDDMASLAAWARGAEAFARDLDAGLARLGPRSEVTLIPAEGRGLRMLIDDRQYIVDAPRPDRQLELESAIAQRACLKLDCGSQPETVAERAERRAESLSESWSFGDGALPTFSASDGLHCVYNDRTHLTLKRRVCEAVLRELRLVAELVLTLTQRGERVDFERLAIVNERGRQQVRYARYRGVDVGLPVLATVPRQLELAPPWLEARSQGRVVNHFLNLPDEVIYATAARLRG